jgi:DNA polymerase-3 subunit beta
MKFTCTQENLYRGLSVVNHLAGKNTTLPILNNVLIRAEDGVIELSTTNLEVGIKCQVRGKIEAAGAFTVQSRLITDYVNLLPKQPVDLTLKDQELHVSCQSFETKVKGVAADDFPLIAGVSGQDTVSLEISTFKAALGQVLFAVALDETRPEINGVLFHLQGKKLVLASTDSFRLAERTIEADGGEKEAKFIVPYRTMQELSRVLAESMEETNLTVGWSDNQVVFTFAGIELVSRLIEGQYPDYQQIVPSHFKTEVTLNSREFVQLVKSAALFCRAGINDVHVTINAAKKTLEVKAANSMLGENKAEMKAETTGEENEIVFNYRYVLDGIQAMGAEEVVMKLIDRHNPGLFLPAGKGGYTYIVMPIKS